MAGRHQNIPLVAKGRAQARAMAHYLEQLSVRPAAIYASGLLRTWEFAAIIREHFVHRAGCELVLRRDDRLLELDYGAWAGLTTDGENNEVVRRFGRAAWDAWQERRIFPQGLPHNWEVTERQVADNIRAFASDLVARHGPHDIVVAVGSQGSLHFLNALLEGDSRSLGGDDSSQGAAPRSRIQTGHFCKLVYEDEGAGGDRFHWRVAAWNTAPADEAPSACP
jgi:probable phosphoglycerate mutase